VAPFDRALEDVLKHDQRLSGLGAPTPAAAISARMSPISSGVSACSRTLPSLGMMCTSRTDA
jgi:hypothetical protein